MVKFKDELREAYEAGIKSVQQNADRNKRLEGGAKEIEEQYNFENWYANQQPESKWETIKEFKLMLGTIG